MNRPRVLLIAEVANPEWPSVPLVGWSHSRALAGVADAHLVTQVRNRQAILRAGLVEGVDFTAIDSERVAAPIRKVADMLRGGEGKGWTTITASAALAYYEFERQVWAAFGARISAREFDIVHRLTPLTPTIPSLIARKCRRRGVPFVWGPINGGVPWPRQFGAVRQREREWLSYLRGAYKLLPGYRSTRANAAAIIVGSRDALSQMEARYRDKCVYIPENAVDPRRFAQQVSGPMRTPIRVCFVGRLVPYKGADMLLEAAAGLIRGGKLVLDVIGDGPEIARLRSMVADQGLDGGVRLEGWVEHEELQNRMVQCDVLGFPSIREFGGGVVLEAMMLGLAPVVVDYGGPGELVTEATGFRVPMGSRDQIIGALRAVLEKLVAAPQSIRLMGQAGRRRVLEQFTWDAKAAQVLQVYAWVMGRRTNKPDFGIPLGDCLRSPDNAGLPAEPVISPSVQPIRQG